MPRATSQQISAILKSLDTNVPHCSVVIPAKNEESEILDCLHSVAISLRHLASSQGVLGEVIVVVNKCEDATPELAQQAGARVITETRTGVSMARDRGLRECNSSSQIVLSTDADTVVPEVWAERHLLQLTGTPLTQVVTGRISIRDRDPAERYHWEGAVWEQNMSFYRTRALDVGGYDTTFNYAEGHILAEKLITKPSEIVYDPIEVSVRELGIKGSWT
jgi:glycosyltransferase involved in cell wall biosynthesis